MKINSRNDEDSESVPLSEVTCLLIGNIGRWQCFISILMSFLKFSVPWIQLGIVFLAYPQTFWCDDQTNTVSRFQNISQYNSCEIVILNSSQFFVQNETKSSRIPCDRFKFDTNEYVSTIISEWSLVCSMEHYVGLSQVSLMSGVLLGNILFGMLSDKYGRRISLLLCIVVQCVSSFASALTPWFTGFIITRFILALASGGITTVTFVLCLETVGGKWKNIIPILYHIPFGLGTTSLAGTAYLLRNWRHIQLVLALLSTTYLVIFLFIMESPKWLLATGKYERAIDTLEKICLQNNKNANHVRKTVQRSIDISINCKTRQQSIFASKNLRNKTLILWIICFLSGMSFFAFIQYVGIVGDDIFLSVSLNGLSILPGTALTLLCLKYLNHKNTIIISQLWTALFFLLIIAVPSNVYSENFAKIAFAVLGIIGLSISMPVLTLYIGQLYPTEVRNAGVGFAMMFNRLGSIISPFIIYLKKWSPTSPYILLAILTLFQTVLLVFIPPAEEHQAPTPERESSEEIDMPFIHTRKPCEQ